MGLIFFDPYTEVADVKANFAFLQETQPLWSPKGNVLSIENRVIVYKGTPYYERLAGEDRLEGDYIDCTYTIQDWRVRWLSRFFHLLLRYILPGVSVIRLFPAHLRLFWSGLKGRFSSIFSRRSRPDPATGTGLRRHGNHVQPSTITIEKGVNT
jgi:hypothetical protein